MPDPLELHVHIPAGLTGVVHIHIGTEAQADVRLDRAGAEAAHPPETIEGHNSDADAEAEIDRMLGRFERHDRNSAARQVYRALSEAGWQVRLPRPRGDRPVSTAAYLRMTYQGRERKVTLYLNSAALLSAGRRERAFVSALPGAVVQTEDDVYFPHSDGAAEQATANAEALQRWADGEHVEEPAGDG
jgi:hypothetical protein